MSDIYSNPNGDTQEITAMHPYGSLERGVAGDYSFSIGAIISEAWTKTRGAKLTIHVALTIYLAILLGVMIALAMFVGFEAVFGNFSDAEAALSHTLITRVVIQLAITAVSGPMMAGLFMIGLRRSVDARINAGTVLNYFHKILPILVATILMYALITLGFILLILPGIYLSVAYYLALPLIVEKNLGPWAALEASRKAVSKRWFAVFGLLVVLTLINAVTVFTLFIGMIWTVPMTVIALGIVYRNMFGVESATLDV